MKRCGLFGALALAGALGSSLLVGCPEEIDFTRPEIERGTLGEELYGQLDRDLARTRVRPAAKAEAFEAMRDDFIWAVDTMMPQDEIPAFEDLALELLPFIDDETMPDLIRKLAFVYEDIVADSAVRQAWARSHRLRAGLEHSGTESHILERILSYPRLRELTEFTIRLLLEHDGLDEAGRPAPQENDFIRRIVLSIRDSLRSPQDPADLSRNLAVVTELLLTPDPRFSRVDGLSPMWAVRPDARGVPRVVPSATGQLPLTFTDTNADGLADIDALGAFVNAGGQSFMLRPYDEGAGAGEIAPGMLVGRDELGRAFASSTGDYVYDYVDLNDTMLGFTARRMPEMIDRDILNDTFIGLDGLLGELDTSGEYPHFTAETPILDLLDATFKVAEFGGLPDVLEAVSLLLRDHERTMATFLLVDEDNGDINDRLGAHLEPNNGFVDDLLPYLYTLAQEKGFLDDLLTALQDPIIDDLMVAMVELMSTYNPAIRPALDGAYNTSVAPCLENYDVGTPERYDCIRNADRAEIFAGDVDHSLPEGPGNTSLHQRLFQLMYDGDGVSFDMEIVEATLILGDIEVPLDFVTDIGPLLTIPNVDAAFFDSVAGNFCLVDVVNGDRIRNSGLLGDILELVDAFGLSQGQSLEEMVTDILVFLSDGLGVHLDPCPTPGQMLRFFNLPSLEMNQGPIYARLADPYDLEGYLFREHNGDTLYAAEATGAIDGLHPIIKVFSDRGLSPLLGQMMAALFRHFPEPGIIYYDADGEPVDFAYSGLRRHEPALIEIYTDGRMIQNTQELASILQNLELESDPQLYVPDLLEELLIHLLAPEEGLENGDGDTLYLRPDDLETPMTRFYILVDALDALDEALEAFPESDAAWERASDELTDLMLEVIDDGSGRGRFEDPGSAAMGAVVTRHLSDHLRRYQDAGVMFERLRTNYPDYVENLITSRGFAAVVQMLRQVRSVPADQALFDDFMRYLHQSSETTTRAALGGLYELLLGTNDQYGYVSVAPFYADLIDPDRTFAVGDTGELPLLTHAVMLIEDLLEVDPDDVGLNLVRRAFVTPAGADEAPISVLARAIRQIHRVTPGSPEPMSADDLERLYTALYSYIRDDFRGVERVFEIVQERAGPLD